MAERKRRTREPEDFLLPFLHVPLWKEVVWGPTGETLIKGEEITVYPRQKKRYAAGIMVNGLFVYWIFTLIPYVPRRYKKDGVTNNIMSYCAVFGSLELIDPVY